MATEYTPNENLYKWKVTDSKQTTIQEMSSNAVKIDEKLNDHSTQLAETKRNTVFLESFSLTIPETDDTGRFQRAVDYCIANRVNGRPLPLVLPFKKIQLSNTIELIGMSIFGIGHTEIEFSPTTPNTDLFHINQLYRDTPINGWGNLNDVMDADGNRDHMISDIYLKCTNSNGNVAINCDASFHRGTFNKVEIKGFKKGIRLFFTWIISGYDVNIYSCDRALEIDTSNTVKFQNIELSNGNIGAYITCSLIGGNNISSFTYGVHLTGITVQSNTGSPIVAIHQSGVPNNRISNVTIENIYEEINATSTVTQNTLDDTTMSLTEGYDLGEFYGVRDLCIRNGSLYNRANLYTIKIKDCKNVTMKNLTGTQNDSDIAYISTSSISDVDVKRASYSKRGFKVKDCTFRSPSNRPILSLDNRYLINSPITEFNLYDGSTWYTVPIAIPSANGFTKVSFFATQPLILGSKVGITLGRLESDEINSIIDCGNTGLISITQAMVDSTAAATLSNPIKVQLTIPIVNFVPGHYVIGVCVGTSTPSNFSKILGQQVPSFRQYHSGGVYNQTSIPTVDTRLSYLASTTNSPIIMLEA